MKQNTIIFEISSIGLLVILGASLSFAQIESTGIFSVAGLLTVFFFANYRTSLLRYLKPTLTKPPSALSSSKPRG